MLTELANCRRFRWPKRGIGIKEGSRSADSFDAVNISRGGNIQHLRIPACGRRANRRIGRPDRVTIETNSPNENCGLVLSRILEWLPVTPISALGHNFKYVGHIDDLPIAAEMAAMIPKAEPQGLAIKQRSCHIGFQRGDITFNLQVAVRGDEAELLANVHLQPPENTGGEEDNQRSIFAKRFLDFRSEVTELLTTSLGVQIR